MSVENLVGAGMPDVNYADGWLELKVAKSWPVRPTTPLRIPHFTDIQRAWHLRRAAAGGRTFVLLRVGREHLLFDGRVAAEHLGNVPEARLREVSRLQWTVGTPMDILVPILTGRAAS